MAQPTKAYKNSLFIFRRDLRMHDNTALQQAANLSHHVACCFIIDPRQAGAKNGFKSNSALQFMAESCRDLADDIRARGGKFYLFSGVAEKIVAELLKKEKFDAVFFNKDYTPFSLKRDEAIQKICFEHGVACHSFDDALLTSPETVHKKDGTPYTMFTPFFKHSFLSTQIAKPQPLKNIHFFSKPLALDKGPALLKQLGPTINKQLHVHGGRAAGLALLKKMGAFKNYSTTRNIPSIATTNLSAHHKFGTLSIRETYHAVKQKLSPAHPLVQQLFWRDFFTHVAYHSPFVFGQPFKQKYAKLDWSSDKKAFTAWCNGTTGFPIVDAGMRQLNATGFMHNRVRMIVASFLVKDLHINWLWGEKYFAQKLVDYDPAVNNGNWQWSASTGCDAQPYFRIFNPWLQQKKFDPQCVYIKRWVPELKNIPAKTIHPWFKETSPAIKGYPRPLVSHEIESKKAKSLYQKVR